MYFVASLHKSGLYKVFGPSYFGLNSLQIFYSKLQNARRFFQFSSVRLCLVVNTLFRKFRSQMMQASGSRFALLHCFAPLLLLVNRLQPVLNRISMS